MRYRAVEVVKNKPVEYNRPVFGWVPHYYSIYRVGSMYLLRMDMDKYEFGRFSDEYFDTQEECMDFLELRKMEAERDAEDMD